MSKTGRADETAALHRLSMESLPTLPKEVARPSYDRAAVSPGIVHLGLGAFCRAHLSVYTDDILAAGATDWGIVGVDLLSPAIRDALKPQDCLYSVFSRQAGGDQLRVVGSMLDALALPDDLGRAFSLMIAPTTRIVTLTVTEKGYCQDAATGALDENNPAIKADIANPSAPRTVPGVLTEAIRLRRAAGVAPFTVLVCDNLAQNGATARRIVVRFAELIDPELSRFIAENIAFPCTMVDRITPATRDEDRAAIANGFGIEDAWPVVCEPFRQWVIEDNFPLGRPRWEDVGALLVKDVHPFELMKLRCLNGAHSTLAYLSVAAGIETIAEAMGDADLNAVVHRLWKEDLIPTLPPVPGTDVTAYTAALEERFLNPGVRHRTLQISSDGSQKLPPRLLEPALSRLQAGALPQAIVLAVAAWMRFTTGVNERQESYDIADPMAARLRAIGERNGHDAKRLAGELFAIADIFPPELLGYSAFRDAVEKTLHSLLTKGVRPTLKTFLG
ncbi:mannitol dehydrogenase family protein [Telmatospirillum siberiense]|uniref:Mannitol dehydrogenase n=1 Tax=Telmatospirillum siberiense TaxID=382514 RepID=A0A2N3PYZ1_9PROT|nr:mannitol dehydrogenase family protein [Telmatospirillum siberiense]PKU25623.1 mannitol dehydrogenase [Telmatospirillum siberiense]